MSFTSTVKNELSKQELNKLESISFLSAILKNIAIIDDKSIKITTENNSVARKIFNIIKDLYLISPKITLRRGYNYNKNFLYILELKEKIDIIKDDLSLNTNIPNDYIIDDDNLTRVYLRGLFISCGSVNDPKKSRYHLEFIVDSKEYASFICDKLNLYFLNSKVLKRENRYMIYIKEAEKIGDFLRMINAISALLNCEQANVDKIIETANNQVKDIKLIESIGGMDLLDEKTKVAAIYRMKYKEVSLQELSEIITLETKTPITKSGLHHRFTKIKEFANKIRNSD